MDYPDCVLFAEPVECFSVFFGLDRVVVGDAAGDEEFFEVWFVDFAEVFDCRDIVLWVLSPTEVASSVAAGESGEGGHVSFVEEADVPVGDFVDWDAFSEEVVDKSAFFSAECVSGEVDEDESDGDC